MKKIIFIALAAIFMVSCVQQKKFTTWKDGKPSKMHNKGVPCAAYD